MPVVTDLGPCTCCGGCPLCPGSPGTVYLTLTGLTSCRCDVLPSGVAIPLVKPDPDVDVWTYHSPAQGVAEEGAPEGGCPGVTITLACVYDAEAIAPAPSRYYKLTILLYDSITGDVEDFNEIVAEATAVPGDGNTCSPFFFTFGPTWHAHTGLGYGGDCIPCDSGGLTLYDCPGLSWATAVVTE